VSTSTPDTAEVPSQERPALRRESNRFALLKLSLALGVIVALFIGLGAGALLGVIVALIVMIMLHELGHFATAKWSGMKVTEYFVGFGPRLWSVKRGETEYGVKAIPAGGYVRIIGMTSAEEIHPDDEPRAYRNQPFGKRIIVASAGSFMHLVIAFVLALIVVCAIGRPNPSVVTVSHFLTLGSGETPAQQAGMQAGDQLVSVNGQSITSANALSSVVSSHAGRPVTVTVLRQGMTHRYRVVPVDGRTVTVNGAPLVAPSHRARGYLGVSLSEGSTKTGVLAGLPAAGSIVWSVTTGSVGAIGHLFSPSGISSYAHTLAHPGSTQNASSAAAQNRPESIVGAVRTATQAAQAGWLAIFEVFIALNVFIGVINMLPMLPLDGGHVVIAAYEWVRTGRSKKRYRADVTKLMPVAYAFVALLLMLVVSSVYLDIAHPMSNPFK
jgi:hypothetical protein